MSRTHVSLSSSLVLVLSLAASAAADPAPVVGGSSVPHGKWPDVVAVLGRDAACTGTLIAPDVVLTAGHCIEINPVEVIVDTIDFGNPGGDTIKVKSARAYPDWEHSYDVGVVILDHVARPAPRAIAAACTQTAHLTDGAKVQVVGFGLTTRAGTGFNTKLHQAAIPVADASCSDPSSCETSVMPGGEFIAGGDGKDACFGDSGGPAFIDSSDGLVVAGVVSRGLALPGAPCGNGGVYVRADKVAAWIEKVTGRKLARSTCDRPGDAPEATATDADAGGCAAGGGGGGGAAIVLCALGAGFLVGFRRRRCQGS